MLFLQVSFLRIKSKYLCFPSGCQSISIFHNTRFRSFIKESAPSQWLWDFCCTWSVGIKILLQKSGESTWYFYSVQAESTYFTNRYPSNNSVEVISWKQIQEISKGNQKLKNNILARLREGKDQWGLTQAKSNFALNKLHHWFSPKSWLFLVKEHDNKLILYIC